MSTRRYLVPLMVMVMAATAYAQPGGRGPGGRGGFGGGFGGGGDSLVDLATREDVGKELEIIASQREDIEAIRDKRQESMRGMRDKLEGVPREEIFTKMRELVSEVNDEADESLSDVLLPHQMKRLKQLQFQRRSRGGVTRALGDEDMAEMLGITDKQREEMQEVAEEANRELQEKMEELRKEAQEKILAVLTPAQRKQWEELAGEPFEFEQTQPQFGGRGNFQPGGGRPGGGRPGGRPDSE